MKKWVLRIVLGLIALVIIAVVLTFVMINHIAKAGIEQGGSYALGVPTTVNTVDLSIFGGKFDMNGLQIANPAGYKGDFLMHSGKFNLKLEPKTVLSDTVVVDSFNLDGLDVIIDKTLSGSNVQVVMDHVQKLGGYAPAPQAQGGQPAPQQPAQPAAQQPAQKPGKKVKVNDLVIRNVNAKFYVMGGPAIPIPVPEIHLQNISSGDGGGVTVPELTAKIFTAILAGVAQQAEKAGVPMDAVANLKDQVAGAAGALGGNTSQLVSQASQVQQLFGPAGSQPAGQSGVKELQHGLGGLLGGRAQSQPAQPSK